MVQYFIIYTYDEYRNISIANDIYSSYEDAATIIYIIVNALDENNVPVGFIEHDASEEESRTETGTRLGMLSDYTLQYFIKAVNAS
jgi:hypothetical protein